MASKGQIPTGPVALAESIVEIGRRLGEVKERLPRYLGKTGEKDEAYEAPRVG